MDKQRDQKRSRKLQKITIPRVIKWLFTVTIAIALIVVLFFSVDYHYNWHTNIVEPILPNIVLLPTGVIAISLVAFLCYKLIKKSRKWLIFLVSVIALIAQVVLIWSYYYQIGWDVSVIFSAANDLAITGEVSNLSYFSTFPNNATIVMLYAGIIKLGLLFGIQNSLFLLILSQCLLCWLTGLMIFYIARKISGRTNVAWFTWILYAIFVGLQPWFSVPYTDGTGIIFPTLILFLYCLEPKKNIYKYLRWAGIVIAAYLAFSIKPQTVIIAIALIVIQIYFILKDKFKNKQPLFTKYRIICLGTSIAALIAIAIPVKLISNTLIPIEEGRSVGVAHYLMMGMNAETRGEYSKSDFEYSFSFQDESSRSTGNLSEAKNRILNMGLWGFLNQMRYKMSANYNDGLFSWGREDPQINKGIPTSKDNWLSQNTTSIYYPENLSENFKYFLTVMQALWLGILFLCLFAGIKTKNKVILVAMLAIIGLTIYEQLFEARARYLFTYIPIFVLLASIGMFNMIKWIKDEKTKRKA